MHTSSDRGLQVLRVAFLPALVFAMQAMAICRAAPTEQKLLTVPDAIETATPTDSHDNDPERMENIAEFSPDGSRFVIVVRRGELAANANRYSMLLWTVSDLRSG